MSILSECPICFAIVSGVPESLPGVISDELRKHLEWHTKTELMISAAGNKSWDGTF